MTDKFTKGVMGDQSGKVLPFPTLDKVQFYREHMERSMTAITELYMQLQQVQDMLFNEIVEYETCVAELQTEIDRVERLYLKELLKTVQQLKQVKDT